MPALTWPLSVGVGSLLVTTAHRANSKWTRAGCAGSLEAITITAGSDQDHYNTGPLSVMSLMSL